MKVYTKTGDKGTTALIGGVRVAKDDLKIEAYGTVDELNSHIGMIRDLYTCATEKLVLLEIQDRLFTLGALLASATEKAMKKMPQIAEEDIEYLEKRIDYLDTELPPLTSFVLPGGHIAVSSCHIARCVCRRAERRIVSLQNLEANYTLVMAYLNRLSDYLFTLSRKIAIAEKAEETPWIPRK
jgi:cob(I)alamin adenosyltransferase